jgi:azurin
LTLKHSGKLAAATMGHNWVLTKTADMQAVSTAGMAATL